MTRLLERAVTLVQRLPEGEQDAIAQLVLDELESERRWDELFAKSPDTLRSLADRAGEEYDAGLTRPLDPDRL